ncbi:aldehyde dehydrogenase family protein [Afifella pfennigii]|uniref:aldehyde dehydrogenase family protein n=1 Tax=Afifella pfennigii TaxID=209897 RepID=UPI00047CBDEC|nr:aldehyde dehydrogenase family protein [Afifella pfennigii]
MSAIESARPQRLEKILAPYDGAVVGEMEVAGAQEVEAALAGALAAFKVMKRLPRFVRADILDRTADIIEARRAEFERLIAAEAGKPLYDARGEMSRSLFNLRNAAREARAFCGHEVPLDVDGGVFEYQTATPDGRALDLGKTDIDMLANLGRRFGVARRFPIGPVLAITPFNFPLNLVLHKVAPAIAVGNSVVLKPAPQTPLTSRLMAEAFAEAGLPEGALTVVHCDVPLAEKMVRDERLKMVTFTGSAKVGWHIKDIAGKKKVALELGGNGAVVVAPDADLEFAAARCVRGGVVYGGQYCIGVQRIYAHAGIYERFKALLVEKVAACRTGDPLQEGVDVGPVIDEGAAKRIESWIEEAVAGGAKLLTGGKREGALIHPTVITDTRPDMKVECEEIFGPVITLTKVETVEEGVRRAANSRYGLQGGFFTNDLRAAFRSLEDWDVGGLMINDVPIYRIDNMPFGGWGDSGFGREGTRYAMESMSDIKFLVVNYG